MGFCGAGGEGEDVGDDAGFVEFSEADGFFEGELVEGVHRHFYPCGFDGGVGCVDARFDLWGLLVIGGRWEVGRGEVQHSRLRA